MSFSAAVAADHPLASAAGAELLRAGGNAVDAAVATSFALSVVRPYSCGIGGGGFMLLHLRSHPRAAPTTVAIDYRETAPACMVPDYFQRLDATHGPDPEASTHGAHAVATPGTVAGLLHALDRYGTLPRHTVLAPAIRLAREGFLVDAPYMQSMREDVLPWFAKDPARARRFPFLWERMLNHGRIDVGDRITLPEQAEALELISQRGNAGFYQGPVALALLEAIRRDGGSITEADLRDYRPVERTPLTVAFRGNNVHCFPPPSSGGIVFAQLAGILSALGPRFDNALAAGRDSPDFNHLLIEALKHAFADRAKTLGDPAFVKIPLARLLDPAYHRELSQRILSDHTQPPAMYGGPSDDPAPIPRDAGTSHLSVTDALGNAVACSETINLIFGSHLAVEPFGFILNNEMDDFLTRPGQPNAFGLAQSNRNLPAPGKRALSSMTPTIVTDSGGAVRFVAGGSGGPRIISATIQVVLGMLLFGDSAADSVSRPRYHHQWDPDVLRIEPALRGSALEAAMRDRGHRTEEKHPIGVVQAIRAVGDGRWEAASDPRKAGETSGVT
jgi:gamma-glutamyltranspeptidase/glutathione hydrolase